MNEGALAELFYREIAKIDHNEELELREKIKALHHLLGLLFVEVTKQERIHFSTLFARIAYAGHQYGLSKRLLFYLHHFRIGARQIGSLSSENASEIDRDAIYQLGLKVLVESVEALLGVAPPSDPGLSISGEWPVRVSPVEVRDFRPSARVVVLEDDADARQLVVRDAADPGELVRVQYGLPDRNENFQPTIDLIRRVFGLPVTLNLLDVEVDVAGVYRPRAFVIEPDYLVDVTAIAECFKPDGNEPWLHLLKKYLPIPPNKYLLLGHIANFFLDELLGNPAATFKELFPRVFHLNPLAFCLFSDREIREIMQRAQGHYVNLKRAIAQDLDEAGIDPAHAYLEPSFYSELYGLQGRLDLFCQREEQAAIVELKSGKPFMPNLHGLSNNHFVQTLLYDLLIRSTFGRQADPLSYILYSSQQERALRYAPRVAAQQYEALQVRNHLLALEDLLARLGAPGADLLRDGRRLFGRLRPGRFPAARGFFRRDLADFAAVFDGLDEVEQRYFTAFSGFIAREHRLAKTGVQGIDRLNGQASLWLNELDAKRDDFEVISFLRVLENKAGEEEPLVTFRKTEATNDLANFRRGDIAVLYPYVEGQSGVLNNQIFKCTILEITNEQVVVRLRSRQFNDALFQRFDTWNLEHDLLDSGYIGLYRGLYAFAAAPKEKRDLLLGRRPPRQGTAAASPPPVELTAEQQAIFQRMLAAEDYFLLWGPPGTGKTSMMLKHLVDHLLNHTEENLLLLAYTNRAVDEICEAIEAIGEHLRDHYLRIGSRYATDERFRTQLLRAKTEQTSSRQELLDIIGGHRIVVATVASISSRPELLELKHFDRVLIDEASQILEPLLAGLLPRFQRFVLIGDHKQLPAVVVQDSDRSEVQDDALRELGLTNLRNSLFERLYKRAIDAGWDGAYAQLSHQGRMHRDIMTFPSRYFYGNTLRILPESLPIHRRQLEAPGLPLDQQDPMSAKLGRRIVFLPTPVDAGSATRKTNRHEAELIAGLVRFFRRQYQTAGHALDPSRLGVITPYRAQIAHIRQVLEEQDIDPDTFTIDTVERYQGGARDVILISLCTNTIDQLTSLVSLSDDGVDRKLNVALTRAREYLVIVGNPELLQQNGTYAELMRFCGVGEERN